ncbi:MAG: Mpo1-like protein [Bdellovibrionota bacterium]
MNELALISQYSTSHQNEKNQLIHFFCVPVIFFNVVALIYAFVPSYVMGAIVLSSLIFYFRSMRSYLPHMIVLYGVVLGICAIFAGYQYFVPVNIGMFVVAWIGQFWGHKIEGKKPSFFEDIFFLLVGPAWVMEKMRLKLTGLTK